MDPMGLPRQQLLACRPSSILLVLETPKDPVHVGHYANRRKVSEVWKESHYVTIYTSIGDTDPNSVSPASENGTPADHSRPLLSLVYHHHRLGFLPPLLSQFLTCSARSISMCWLTQRIELKDSETSLFCVFVWFSSQHAMV